MSYKELKNILDNFTCLKKDGNSYLRNKNGNENWCSASFLPDDRQQRLSQFGGEKYDGNHIQIGHLYQGIALTHQECLNRLKKYLKNEFYHGEYYLKIEFDNWFSKDFVFVERPDIKSRIIGQSWEKIFIKDFKHNGIEYKNGHVLYANLDGTLQCKVENDKFIFGTNDVSFPYEIIKENFKNCKLIEPYIKDYGPAIKTQAEIDESVELRNIETAKEMRLIWDKYYNYYF